jgi:hypothetical protein
MRGIMKLILSICEWSIFLFKVKLVATTKWCCGEKIGRTLSTAHWKYVKNHSNQFNMSSMFDLMVWQKKCDSLFDLANRKSRTHTEHHYLLLTSAKIPPDKDNILSSVVDPRVQRRTKQNDCFFFCSDFRKLTIVFVLP